MKTCRWSLECREWAHYYRVAGVRALEGIPHAFSTRRGGREGSRSFNLGDGPHQTHERTCDNRNLFLACLGYPLAALRTVKQTHSNRVVTLTDGGDESRFAPTADAVVTDLEGRLLGIVTADCCPILIADPIQRVVAAVHAGWRGTASGIAARTVAVMRAVMGCQLGNLLVMIGPGIGSCCYQVGENVREAFVRGDDDGEAYFRASPKQEGDLSPRWNLDLVEANRAQLLRSGVAAGQVTALGACTACHPDLFFSYRREGPGAGRMLSIIGLSENLPQMNLARNESDPS